MQKPGKDFLEKIDDNAFYRLMNNQWMDWRRLLIGFAKQFAAYGDLAPGTTCFILDDTDIEKTGKTIEFVGRRFNHVTKFYPFGYKLLLLDFWDGKSLVATDFSLHRPAGERNLNQLSLSCTPNSLIFVPILAFTIKIVYMKRP